MQTVTGFDLRPVYNMYENFFSAFDIFRLMCIDAPWQKQYGYPYVDPNQFTRREIQEMFLKEFQFENPGDTTGFYKGHLHLDARIALQDDIRYKIQETRCLLNLNNENMENLRYSKKKVGSAPNYGEGMLYEDSNNCREK